MKEYLAFIYTMHDFLVLFSTKVFEDVSVASSKDIKVIQQNWFRIQIDEKIL